MLLIEETCLKKQPKVIFYGQLELLKKSMRVSKA